MRDALPPIVFLRHGETDWNVNVRLQGQRDIPLNAKGRLQARRNGEVAITAIADVASFDFVASPLVRARETMEIARRAMGLDPALYRLDDRLQELTFGDWEGLTIAELHDLHPELARERLRDKWAFVPPKGESYEGLSRRVAGWLESVAVPTFVVSHGGVGRVLRHMLLAVDPLEAVSADFSQDQLLVFRDGGAEWI